jgi:hypothetical protein
MHSSSILLPLSSHRTSSVSFRLLLIIMKASQLGIVSSLLACSLQMQDTQAAASTIRGQRQLQENHRKKTSKKDDTEAPTEFPTSAPSSSSFFSPSTLPLGFSINFPLSRCQGDCDSDEECQEDLICFQRDGGESVPGCSDSDVSSIDYCIAASSSPPPQESFSTTVAPTMGPTTSATATPVWDACEKAQTGDVFTTPYGMSVLYYYEVLTTKNAVLLDVSRNVDATFQQFLATSLVNCASAELSEIQGISPAGVDNLAGDCESNLAKNALLTDDEDNNNHFDEDNNNDLVCYQMQGSVEVYLAEYYYFSLSAATSNNVRDLVWDTLREEINPTRRRRRLSLANENLGIYGLFFVSGTEMSSGVDTAQEAPDTSSGGILEGSGIDTFAAIGIVFACFALGVILFATARKYRTYTNEQADYKLEHSSVFTDSDVGETPETEPGRTPSPSLFRKSPPMVEYPPPSLFRESSPMESPPPSPTIPPTKVHYKPRRDARSQTSGSAFEVLFEDEPFPSKLSPENSSGDGWSLPGLDARGDLLADSGIMKPPSPPPPRNAPSPLPPMSNVGIATILAEEQFRVTGYSHLSSISTLAEHYERPAMITPIIKPEFAPIQRGRDEKPPSVHSNKNPQILPLLRNYNTTKSSTTNKKKKPNPFTPIDPNQSQAPSFASTRDYSKPKPQPPSSGAIPRSQTTYSSRTTKLSNRRAPSNLTPYARSPTFEEFHPIPDTPSSNSEDIMNRLGPDDESSLDLGRLAAGVVDPPTRIPIPGTPSSRSSHSSQSYGSFNFETLSSARSTVQSTRSQQTPQSQFEFVERGSPQNLYSMPDPISMAFANNAMHSAFKPKKLAYPSGGQLTASSQVGRRRGDRNDSTAL